MDFPGREGQGDMYVGESIQVSYVVFVARC